MAIEQSVTVPGKVLRTGDHIRFDIAADQSRYEFRHLFGVAAHRTVADDLIFWVGKNVGAGGIVEIDSDRFKLLSHALSKLKCGAGGADISKRLKCGPLSKGWLQPMNTAPNTTQRSAGIHPQITATAGPSIGARPVIEAK